LGGRGGSNKNRRRSWRSPPKTSRSYTGDGNLADYRQTSQITVNGNASDCPGIFEPLRMLVFGHKTSLLKTEDLADGEEAVSLSCLDRDV